MSDNYPILSTQNLTSAKTLKTVAIAVPVAGLVFFLLPWWVIGAGVVGGGVYAYNKINKINKN